MESVGGEAANMSRALPEFIPFNTQENPRGLGQSQVRKKRHIGTTVKCGFGFRCPGQPTLHPLCCPPMLYQQE